MFYRRRVFALSITQCILIYSIIGQSIHLHLVNIVAVKAKQNSRKMSRVHVNHSYVCPTIWKLLAVAR